MAIENDANVGRAAAGTAFDRFLTPESMLTPGVAGSMTMMIGNALHYNFGVPNGWAILVVSFVFGVLVWVNNKPIFQRAALYVLNSLVIFCVAAGTITISSQTPQTSTAHSGLFIGMAYAQNSPADLKQQYEELTAQHNAVLQRLKGLQSSQDVSSAVTQLEQIDRKRSDVANAIAAQAKESGTSTSTSKTFFAPLKF